jgi:hypothetical protein
VEADIYLDSINKKLQDK